MSLTRRELIDLASSLRDRWILSVYIDTRTADPAARIAWKTTLHNTIEATRDSSPAATRKQLERAIEQLDARVETLGLTPGHTGWYAFVTENGIEHAGACATGMGTVIRWQRGAWILPFASLLERLAPALVVLIDSRSAAVHAYSDRRLESRAMLHVRPHGGDAPHMGDPATPGFHGGTRGMTKHDAAQRARLSANRRLLAETTRAVTDTADDDSWIVIGGSRDLPIKLREHLPARLRERTVVLPELRRRVSRAAIVDAAEHGIGVLRATRDRALLEALFEHTGAHTNAVVGLVATLEAVQRGSAASVLLTSGFLALHSDEAERVLEGALAEGGDVHLLDGDLAAELDAHGGGIGAMLRFVPAYAHARTAG